MRRRKAEQLAAEEFMSMPRSWQHDWEDLYRKTHEG